MTVATRADFPSIASQPEAGQHMTIGPVIAEGVLVGYGDVNANPGPIDALALAQDGTITTLLEALPTEVIDKWRVLNDDAVWIPSIDPHIDASGFLATNQGGTWRTETVSIDGLPVVEHMFDVAQEPNGDLYVAVTYPPDTAAIWKKANLSATWQQVFAYASGKTDGYTRFYNFRRSDGRLSTQRNDGTRYLLAGNSWATADIQFDETPAIYPMLTLPNAGNGWTASLDSDGSIWLCDGDAIYLLPPT